MQVNKPKKETCQFRLQYNNFPLTAILYYNLKVINYYWSDMVRRWDSFVTDVECDLSASKSLWEECLSLITDSSAGYVKYMTDEGILMELLVNLHQIGRK